MISQGAKLQDSRVEESLEIEGSYHTLFFSFPKEKNTSKILYEKFYLTTNNKCVRYEIMYLGEEWFKQLKDSLDKTPPGLKQLQPNDSLRWIGIRKNYNVYILRSLPN